MSVTGKVPIRDPLGLRDDVITNPHWVKWLTEQLAPAITAVTVGGIPQLTGTRAQRLTIYPAGNYPPGVLFFESDTDLVYIVNGDNEWQYSSGTYERLQSELTTLAATLGANDARLMVDVTDYDHKLKWTGTAWKWGDGERSAYFQDFAIAPDSPGWHLCDGAVGVSYLKGDGSTGVITLPNSSGSACYRKLGTTYYSIITAAVVPTLAMNPYTPTGTNSVPVLTMDSYTPQGTNSAPVLTMNSYTPAGTISAPTLTMNSYTPTGGVSAPTFTGTPATISNAVFTAGLVTALTALGGSTTSYTPAGTVSAATFTGIPAILTGTVSVPTFTGTPATLTGSVSSPVFTGTAHVLTGTISAPLFTGNVATLTGTISLPGDPVAHHQAVEYFRQ